MKKYLLMVDDVGMAMCSHILKAGTFEFLPVEGMPLNDDGKYNVMLTPCVTNASTHDLEHEEQATEPVCEAMTHFDLS